MWHKIHLFGDVWFHDRLVELPGIQLHMKDDPARLWVRQLSGMTAAAAAATEWNLPTRQAQLVWAYPAWFSSTFCCSSHGWWKVAQFWRSACLSADGDFGYLETQSTSVWVGEAAECWWCNFVSALLAEAQVTVEKILIWREIEVGRIARTNLLIVIGWEAYQ